MLKSGAKLGIKKAFLDSDAMLEEKFLTPVLAHWHTSIVS